MSGAPKCQAIPVTALLLLSSACQKAQPSEPGNDNGPGPTPVTGTVAGRVTDLDTPSRFVIGATVDIGGRSAVTGSVGDYLIQNVPRGTQPLTASASGYDSYFDDVVVVAGTSVAKNFSMARTVREVVLVPVADAYTNSSSPFTNYGSELALYTGIINLGGAGNADYTSFIQFSLTSITQAAAILDASLELSPANTGAPTGNTGYTSIYRVAGPNWTEAAITFQNQPSPFLTALATRQVTFAAGPPLTFDVTPAVQAWVNRGDSNYGFLLNTSNITGTYDYGAFYSRDAASGNYVRLVVRFLNP